MKEIPVAGPWITEREIQYAADAAANAWYDRAGEYPSRFETAFADYAGRSFAVSLPSCTSALHLSLLAHGIGPGDEVVVPDVTWLATCAPVVYVGATPIFCEIDPVTWCLDSAAVQAALSPRTKAIIAVDLYGGFPDMRRLVDLAEKNGVALIEDAAEAVGSRYCGSPAGSFGQVSVFSFHGSKTLTTGEGGMLLTDDEALYERVRVLRDHGRPPGDRKFLNTEIGYKYKMSALQAAIGLAQIERLDELVERKRAIFAWYEARLPKVLTLNAEPEGTLNSYWMTTILWPAELHLDKFELMERLARRHIVTRPFFSPLSSLPALADSKDRARAAKANCVSYDISARGLNLPSALCLTEQDIDYVCAAIDAELSCV